MGYYYQHVVIQCPGGRTPIYKGQGHSSQILKRTPKRCQDPALCVWLEIFSLLRDTNSITKDYLLSYFFRLSTLQGTA